MTPVDFWGNSTPLLEWYFSKQQNFTKLEENLKTENKLKNNDNLKNEYYIKTTDP